MEWFYDPSLLYPLAFTLLLLTTFLMSLAYMVATALGLDKVLKWVKMEFYQNAATAFTIVFMLAITNLGINVTGLVLEDVGQQIPGGYFDDIAKGMENLRAQQNNNPHILSTDYHILFGKAYLMFLLDKLNDMVNFLYIGYSTIETGVGLADLFFPGGVRGTVGRIAVVGSGGLISGTMYTVLEYAYYGYLFIYMELAFIEFAEYFYPFALFTGLILRCFPFTRSVGSFFVSLAIGVYFVYPFVLGLLLLSNVGRTIELPQSKLVEFVKDAGYVDEYIYFHILAASRGHEFKDDPMLEGGALSMLNNLMMFVLLQVTLYPMIAAVATYTFIHQFSGLMQANVAELGRGLLKLI